MSPERMNIIRQLLNTVMNGAVLRLIWSLPLWLVTLLGLLAFTVLMAFN
jgi:cell division septal protein FtsQ